MLQQDPVEQDVYQLKGQECLNSSEFDFEFVSEGQSSGAFYFHNSNTLHECRFEMVSTAMGLEEPTPKYEIILTEQMVQVIDTISGKSYLDKSNKSGLIEVAESDGQNPPTFWMSLNIVEGVSTPGIMEILIGIGKTIDQETKIYKTIIPIQVAAEGGLIPLNIRSTSQCSYMYIVDMGGDDMTADEVPIQDSVPEPEPDPIQDLNQETTSTQSGWRWGRRVRSGHHVSQHLYHIMDKTTIPPN